MKYKLIKPDEFKTVPWKNAKGITKELAVRYGEDKEQYLWRISIAGVSENGPFSEFYGYDRTLLVLEGNGIILRHSDGTVNILNNIYDTAHFSGDIITKAEIVDGAIKDFNVITLRSECLAETKILLSGERLKLNGDETCFFASSGNAEFIYEENTVFIPENHLLIFLQKTGSSIHMQSGRLIAVTIIYTKN